MARRSNSRTKKSKGVKIDFSDVGKQFEGGMEYPLEVEECTQEEGNEAPYFAIKFQGVDEDYQNSIMYHNASTAPQSLWRLRPLLEALGFDIPEGPLDISADDFVGRRCMASTMVEKKPGGGSSVKPDEFWPMEEGGEGEEEEEPASEGIDLDELSDDDIKALAKEFGIKSKSVKTLRNKLAEADEEEVAEACEELGIGGEEEEEEEEEAPPPESRKKRGKKKAPAVTEAEVQGMNEEELEELIEQHDLEVDLDDYKTLRKKKVAVIDALQEAGIIEDE